MRLRKDPVKKMLRKQERETRKSQRKYERESKKAMRQRLRRRYQNGGRGPGGFLSRTLAGGVPDYMKKRLSTAPYRSDVETRYRDGSRSQYQSRGHSLALKELIEFYKTAGRGQEGKKIIGIPTGRQYEDYAYTQHRDDYNPSGELVGEQSLSRIRKKDDFEKTYSQHKGEFKQGQSGGKRKTVEVGGEDLNMLQRLLPRLLLERYKVKSKYDPAGELIKRITTSRAGGREVERFPTRAELEAIIADDIRRAELQNGE
jgi:hypothetical protein